MWGRESVQRRTTGSGRWRLSAAPPPSSAALPSGSAGPSESDAPAPETQSQCLSGGLGDGGRSNIMRITNREMVRIFVNNIKVIIVQDKGII